MIHQECLGLLENSFEKSNGNKREAAENCFKCEECRTGQHVCFVCKLGYDVEPSQPATRKCAVASCGKFYHDKCVESSELFRKDASWTTNKPAYICPQHACNTCWVDYKVTQINACKCYLLSSLLQLSENKILKFAQTIFLLYEITCLFNTLIN